MTRRTFSVLLLAVGFISIALITGCKGNLQTTPIKTLLDDPARFDKQIVRISGTVTKSVGVMGYGAYEVNDGTGTLPVVSKDGGAPRQGATVGVEGEFRSAFTLGTETAAVLLEKGRYTP